MTRRQNTITWDHDKRLALFLLRNDPDFDLTWPQINDVFLSLFEDVTATDVRGALRSQDSERVSRRKRIWQEFHSLVLRPDQSARKARFKRLIEESIATLENASLASPESRQSACPSKQGLRNSSTAGGRVSLEYSNSSSRLRPLAFLPISPSQGRSSSRKRHRSDDDDSDDDEIRVAHKRVHQQRYDQPQASKVSRGEGCVSSHLYTLLQVQIFRRPTGSTLLITPPQTPKKKINLGAPMGSTATHRQVSGLVVKVSPKNLAKTHEDLDEVSYEEAHPLQCRTGLFFRYYRNDQYNNDTGFIARKYRGRLQVQQAPPSSLDWTDVFYHIDPQGKTNNFESPFVSISDKYWWILRLGLKELNSGIADGQIAVIDAAALDHRAVFHVLPYHRQLRKKYEFTAGAWHYAGTHEFLCCKEIPARAILTTFSVREIYASQCAKTLRLDGLGERGGFLRTVLPGLQRENVGLTPRIIGAVAELASSIGLDVDAKTEHLAHLWTDIIQGLGVRLDQREPEEWIQLAARFPRALGDSSGRILPSRDSKRLELAFLEGVHWGSSKNFHTRYDVRLVKNKDAQARMIGLADPARLLSGEDMLTTTTRETIRSFQYRPRKDSTVAAHIDVRVHRAGARGKSRRSFPAPVLEAEGEDSPDGDEILYDE